MEAKSSPDSLPPESDTRPIEKEVAASRATTCSWVDATTAPLPCPNTSSAADRVCLRSQRLTVSSVIEPGGSQMKTIGRARPIAEA
eukprot:scaffold22737_cov32-Tisochrysis_lutea.AAC.4